MLICTWQYQYLEIPSATTSPGSRQRFDDQIDTVNSTPLLVTCLLATEAVYTDWR